MAEEGEDEVGGGVALEEEVAGLGVDGEFALGGMHGAETQVVAASTVGTEADGGGLTLSDVDAEGVLEVGLWIEVVGELEGLGGEELDVAEAVEGEHFGLGFVVLEAEQVPAPFVGFEGVGAEEAVVGLGVELLIGGLEAALLSHGLDDEVEVLHALRGGVEQDALADGFAVARE